jgi:hypothetical protein
LQRFQFINVSQPLIGIDQTSRTLIRKHAKFHQIAQKIHRYEYVKSQREGVTDISRKTSGSLDGHNLEQISGVDPFEKQHVKLKPYMHDLLSYCKYFQANTQCP